jgi:hypothetical protein
MLCDKPSVAKMRSQFGLVTARIAQAALALSQGDGRPTHAQIAKKARSSPRTVKRALKALLDAGWITSERGQRGCTYHLVEGQPDRPFGLSEPLYREGIQTRQANNPPKGGKAVTDCFPPPSFMAELVWLLQIFGDYVAAQPGRGITDRRLQGWAKGATDLIRQGRPMAEIARVLAWVFDEHDGVLPFPVSFRPRGFDHDVRVTSKVTSLRQIARNYDRITQAMSLPSACLAGGAHAPASAGRRWSTAGGGASPPHPSGMR